ncbi:HAD-like protein [Auriculariales sp. MPI-PUGE-AT-0066]|nr:HAD-like protein [Auriculariales sp. MPI-PUGE-AT-0066]
MIPAVTSHKVLCFDCYGTIINWEQGILDGLQPLLAASGSQFTQKEALEAFGSVELELQSKHPDLAYTPLLAESYAAFGQRLGLPASLTGSDPAAVAFGQSVGDWSPFPDSAAALGELSKDFKLVVLSNVDAPNIARTRQLLEGPGQFQFDLILTAQEIGSYKPALANFEVMLAAVADKFGVTDKSEVLVVAQSRVHDHVPANALGLESAWIDRQGAIMGHESSAKFTYRFNTLSELANAVKQEKTGNPEP